MLPITQIFRLVKSEDLNHHGTFFAGRCSEWFVESGFICVARKLAPNNIVCLKVHGLAFLHPVHLGDILCFESRIVKTGRSTLTVYVTVKEEKTGNLIYTDGFITFCHVDLNTKSQAHGLSIKPETEEEIQLFERAKNLPA
ncbi:MAG: hotdog domain-containing protein [Bacteroidales bacterium]